MVATPPYWFVCEVCNHTVPGKTCDEITWLTPNLDAWEVCQELEFHNHCDCTGCECMERSPPSPALPPPFPPTTPPSNCFYANVSFYANGGCNDDGLDVSRWSQQIVIPLTVVIAMLPTINLLRRAVKRMLRGAESIQQDMVQTLTLRLEKQQGQPVGLSLTRRMQAGLPGLAVSAVEPDSAAARGGVTAGDVLLRLNGVAATSTAQVAGLLEASEGLVELSVQSAVAAALSTPLGAASSAAVKGRLRAARE